MKKLILLILTLIASQAFATTHVVDLNVDYKTVNFAGKNIQALAINNQIPAPTLHFKEGDHVILNVHNHMKQNTSIHWHGLLLPWVMDGVEGVTQEPIRPGQTFRYEFTLKQSGTYWYHAHSGFQEQQGVYGAFIIDPINQPPYQYDKDYVMVLSDWSNTPPEQIFANLKKSGEYYSTKMPIQPSLMRFLRDYRNASPAQKQKLLADYKMMQNMRMSIYDFADVAYDAFLLNGQNNARPWTGAVKVGDVVRLRFIGAAGSTIYRVKIPGAIMKMVHIQGHDVTPYDVQDFTIAPGETYDVLVKIQKSSPYIIYAESADTLGVALGALVKNPAEKVNYKSVKPFPIPEPISMMGHEGHGGMAGMSGMSGMNHSQHTQNMKLPTLTTGTKYQHLKAAYKTNDPNKPVEIIKMELSGYMGRYMWFINGKAEHEAPPIMIEHGKRYRIIFTNTSMMHHPMHLHGHFFILRNGHGAYDPLLHTISVAPGATVVTDFEADTHGQWFFHCHHLYHMMTGMARTFRYTSFGQDENALIQKQMMAEKTHHHGEQEIAPYGGLSPREIAQEKAMLEHTMGHPPGLYLSNFIEFSYDPFHDVEQLTVKSMFGGDRNKIQFYMKEAEINEGSVEHLDADIFYWHLLSEFWAIKGGANYVYRPGVTPYWQPGVGIEGTMPYFIETDLRSYYHEDSVKFDLDFLRETQITDRLFIETEARGIFATNTVERDEVGSGLNTIKLAIGPHYQLTPAWGIFFRYEYSQNFGDLKELNQEDGEPTAENTFSFGAAVLF